MNILFFGTPEIAVPFLEWSIEHGKVVGVVCRPDEPAGRGWELRAPPTKLAAIKKGIPVFQPSGPWTDEIHQALRNCGAELGIVVAYGRILPRTIFSIPQLGCVNLHFSLLPKFRGAAPMQAALINGETETGVTAFWLEEGLDSGPLCHQMPIPIAPDDDAASLQSKLVPLGLRVLEKVIGDAEVGNIRRAPQVGEPTFAPALKKEMGKIDWRMPAQKIVNLVRGISEWPVASTSYSSQGLPPKQLKILKASQVDISSGQEPGTIVNVLKDQGILVQSGLNQVLLAEVKPEGKNNMTAWSFWQGARMKMGDRFF